MEKIKLEGITWSHEYHRTDNRKKKDYRCTLVYIVKLSGVGMQYLPAKLVKDLRKYAPSVTWSKDPGNNDTPSSATIRATLTFQASKPSKILPEEEVLSRTVSIREKLTSGTHVLHLVEQTNKKRAEVAQDYEALLEEIQSHKEGAQARLHQTCESLTGQLKPRAGSCSRALQWQAGEVFSADVELREFCAVYEALVHGKNSARELLECFAFEVDSRTDDLCYENTHCSTSALANGFSYVEGQVKKYVLKILRGMLRRLQREKGKAQ